MKIILIHGFAMGNIFLKPLAKVLSKNHTIHLLDLPGFGKNHKSKPEESFEIFCENLANQLPSNAIWIGWSMGSLITSWIAIHFPKKVEKLINIASSPCFKEQKNWPGQSAYFLDQFSKKLEKNPKKALQHFFALQTQGLKGPLRRQARNLFLSQPFPNHEALKIYLRWLCEMNLEPYLDQIKCPCLDILGETDSIVPIEIAGKLNNKLNRKVICMSEAGHLPFLSHLNDVVEHIEPRHSERSEESPDGSTVPLEGDSSRYAL